LSGTRTKQLTTDATWISLFDYSLSRVQKTFFRNVPRRNEDPVLF